MVRDDRESAAMFLGRLHQAPTELRTEAHSSYAGRCKLPLTALADQLGYSRGHFHALLNSHQVDRTALRWWQPGQSVPLREQT